MIRHRQRLLCLLILLFPARDGFTGQNKYGSLPGVIGGEGMAGSSAPAGVTVDGGIIRHEKLSDNVGAYSFALDKNNLAHVFYYSGDEFNMQSGRGRPGPYK